MLFESIAFAAAEILGGGALFGAGVGEGIAGGGLAGVLGGAAGAEAGFAGGGLAGLAGAGAEGGAAGLLGGISNSSLLTAGVGAAGLGMQLLGTRGQVAGAQASSQAQQDLVNAQQEQDRIRQQAAALDAQRRQLQTVREAQVARSMALTSATAQGAQGGSGLQGGYGQIAGQLGVNTLGIQQNLQLGQDIFGIETSQVTPAKLRYAQAQGQISTSQGLSSFGGSIMNSLPTIGKLSQGFGNSNPYSSQSYNYTGNFGTY